MTLTARLHQQTEDSITRSRMSPTMRYNLEVSHKFAVAVAVISAHFGRAQGNSDEVKEGSKEASTTFTVLAFFLIFCSATAGLFTIYLIKWEFDRLYILHKLYKKGIPIMGKVRRRETPLVAASSAITKRANRRRRSTVARRTTLYDAATSEQAHKQGLVGSMVEVAYEVEDESDGTVVQCLAGFNDETLYKRVDVGASVPLLVHPQNCLITRPVGTNKRSCISRDSSGRIEALCEVAVGTLSLVTGVFCITFALFLHQLFMSESASLEFDISNVIGWVVVAIAILLLLIPLLPRLTSSHVTELEFENAREIIPNQETLGEAESGGESL